MIRKLLRWIYNKLDIYFDKIDNQPIDRDTKIYLMDKDGNHKYVTYGTLFDAIMEEELDD